ncbi:MAG: hypothetical protein SGI91_19615 [Alphaproteobacteria bacterium]|jgi:hypothetical protein|nr:hypothetical protein [Alphaproteobacteria bacterium]
MSNNLVRYRTAATTASVAFLGSSGVAQATARTPHISGNGWVALGIIAFLVAVIWFVISGALHLERRDAALGRGVGSKRDRGWFGIFGGRDDDDDDGHNGNGGEGSG